MPLGVAKVCHNRKTLSKEKGGNMSEKDRSEEDMQEQEKKDEAEELPYCTTAPSAEHARINDEDEPCDDGRAGE
jgi:hypothetical protein